MFGHRRGCLKFGPRFKLYIQIVPRGTICIDFCKKFAAREISRGKIFHGRKILSRAGAQNFFPSPGYRKIYNTFSGVFYSCLNAFFEVKSKHHKGRAGEKPLPKI